MPAAADRERARLIVDGAGSTMTAPRTGPRSTGIYVLEPDRADGAAPLLSVYGGKIATCRRLAERAVADWMARRRGHARRRDRQFETC